MAEHIGIVTNTSFNGYAQVIADRKGACGGCQPTSTGCRSCLVGAKMTSIAANPVNANTGDLVKIQLSSASLLTGAAILYLLPIFGLLLGAFGGLWLETAVSLPDMVGSIGGTITGLGIGFGIAVAFDRSLKFRDTITPTITEIVVPTNGQK